MFFRKQKRALEERIASLEQALSEERRSHEADVLALEELKNRYQQRERVIEEFQDACDKKLQELEERKAAFELQQSRILAQMSERSERQILTLQAEAETAHKELEKELKTARENFQANLTRRVQSFSDNYNYYLSQLKLVMDMLTEVSIQTGKVFLSDEHCDTDALFRMQFERGFIDDATGLEPSDANESCCPNGLMDEATADEDAASSALSADN